MAMLPSEKLLKIKIPLGIGVNDTSQDALLEYLLEQVDDVAKSVVLPFEDWEYVELPNKYDLWTVRATVEMFNHMGLDGVRSYSENGLSITYEQMKNGLSEGTLSQLTPRAGVPK